MLHHYSFMYHTCAGPHGSRTGARGEEGEEIEGGMEAEVERERERVCVCVGYELE